jgi:hypothetical protein
VVTVGAVELPQLGDHICAFVDGPDDGLDVIAGSVTAGLEAGDKVVVLTGALPPVAVLAGLEARGVPGQSGQVEILPAAEAFLPDGRFEPRSMLASLAAHVERATAAGHRGLRLVCDMAWAAVQPAAADRLAGYESQVSRLQLDGRLLAVCLYDRHAFDPGLLRQVASAHPATSTTGHGGEAGWVAMLRMRRTGAPYGLRLSGEADLNNRRSVAAALEAVLEGQPDPALPIVIDVAGLRFADASTAVLLGNLALRAPAGVHITGCHGTVETILDSLGVTRLPAMRLIRAAGSTTHDVETEKVR